MAVVQIVNKLAQPAQKGQSVLIIVDTLDAEQLDYLSQISINDFCELDSSGRIGFISSIDIEGSNFKINPQYPYSILESMSTGGILSQDEIINVTI